jgi:hypothetical protein
VLAGQLVVDPGANLVKVSSLAGMFMLGTVAEFVGRLVGLGVGIAWLISSSRRAAADPKIQMRRRSANAEHAEMVLSEDKSLV